MPSEGVFDPAVFKILMGNEAVALRRTKRLFGRLLMLFCNFLRQDIPKVKAGHHRQRTVQKLKRPAIGVQDVSLVVQQHDAVKCHIQKTPSLLH